MQQEREVRTAAADVLLGASLRQVAAATRERLLVAVGRDPEKAAPDAMRAETAAFMRELARHLGDRHQGDVRVGQALRDWIRFSDHYEAWDALLSGFDVEGREALIRRGRVLFPGPLTRHWTEG